MRKLKNLMLMILSSVFTIFMIIAIFTKRIGRYYSNKTGLTSVSQSRDDVRYIRDIHKIFSMYIYVFQFYKRQGGEKGTPYFMYLQTLGYLNISFTIIFSIESILKILAFGPRVSLSTLIILHFPVGR